MPFFPARARHGEVAQRKFSIGIDLGTNNSVLAFSELSGEDGTEVLEIPRWDTPSTVKESETLPSFLYLPEDAVAAQIQGQGPGAGNWVAVGGLAQRRASETPGRVVNSARSWLCRHAAERSSPFLAFASHRRRRRADAAGAGRLFPERARAYDADDATRPAHRQTQSARIAAPPVDHFDRRFGHLWLELRCINIRHQPGALVGRFI